MQLSVQNIVAMAFHKVQEPIKDFIFNGDAFVLMAWNKNHYYFHEYGICSSYTMNFEDHDTDIKMHYFSLEKFPPVPMSLNLSAEDIVRGKYIKGDRTYEFKKFNDAFNIRAEILDDFTSHKLSSEKVNRNAMSGMLL